MTNNYKYSTISLHYALVCLRAFLYVSKVTNAQEDQINALACWYITGKCTDKPLYEWVWRSDLVRTFDANIKSCVKFMPQ